MYKRKSWKEKLADNKDFPRIEKITERQKKCWGTGTIVIPKPMEVDDIMKKVPRGKLITINQIRQIVAKRHGATIGCPIAVGLFACIASHVAREEEAAGKKRITPFWRTVKSGGELNPKYPGGIRAQKKRLESEGHRVLKKGETYKVDNFEMHLVKI